MKKHAHRYIRHLYIRFVDDDITGLSAQVAFYILLSLFPFLLFLINILSLAPVSVSQFTQNVTAYVPADIGDLISEIIAETVNAQSTAVLSIGFIVSVWSASRGINALRKGLNKAYDLDENRPLWKVRGLAVLFTICLGVIILTALLVLIFGRIFGRYLFNAIGVMPVFPEAWVALRYIIPLIITVFVLCLLYKCVPNHRIKLKYVLPGALITTLGWVILSAVFSFYIDNFTSYAHIYGSIGGIIIFIIWLYISSLAILLGGEINATLAYFGTNQNLDKYENAQLPRPFRGKKKTRS